VSEGRDEREGGNRELGPRPDLRLSRQRREPGQSQDQNPSIGIGQDLAIDFPGLILANRPRELELVSELKLELKFELKLKLKLNLKLKQD
jgi:hypothetical protein